MPWKPQKTKRRARNGTGNSNEIRKEEKLRFSHHYIKVEKLNQRWFFKSNISSLVRRSSNECEHSRWDWEKVFHFFSIFPRSFSALFFSFANLDWRALCLLICMQRCRVIKKKLNFFSILIRSIPQAGYIKLGSIRYGIRITNLNLQDYPLQTSTIRSNKPQILSAKAASSSIMSPSASINAKAICNDECCCCISSSSTSSKTRLPISQSGERNNE